MKVREKDWLKVGNHISYLENTTNPIVVRWKGNNNYMYTIIQNGMMHMCDGFIKLDADFVVL